MIPAALMLAFPCAAVAQRDYESGFSIVISEVRLLTVETESAFIAPDAGEVLSGWTGEQTLGVTVSANTEWVLWIRGTEPAWDGPWSKPIGDIHWSCGESEYVPLDTMPAEVCAGGMSDHEPYQINFKIALDPLKDVPGDYYYTYIVIELTSP
jgi:hypothetical protein